MTPTAHHTGLTVADLDASVELYTTTLDCTVETDFTVSGEALATVLDTDDVTGRFVHLRSGATRIELVEYDSDRRQQPNGESQANSSLTDPGTVHLAFAVEDVDSFVEAHSDSLDALSEPRTTESGTRLVFVRDPEGRFIELLEV